MIDESDETVLNLISWVLSGLSVISLLFAILVYFFGMKKGSYRVETIVWLLFTTLFDNCSQFIPINSSTDNNQRTKVNTICLIQSIINTIFGYSVCIWCALIGYTAFINVIKPEHVDNHKCRYRILYALLAFGIPLLMATM